MEIKMNSENESQLTRIRKPPLFLTEEESLAKEVEKYPYLFDKNQKAYKERYVFPKIFLVQNLRFFFPFRLLFIEVLKAKITVCQTLRCPS